MTGPVATALNAVPVIVIGVVAEPRVMAEEPARMSVPIGEGELCRKKIDAGNHDILGVKL